MSLRFMVRAQVRATEDVRKVERAVRHLFPEGRVAALPREVTMEGTDLQAFELAIRKQMIPDATRGVLLRGRDESLSRTSFIIGKQQAFVGKLAFITERESPLGDLRVEIAADSAEELEREIVRMAPNTRTDEYKVATGWNPEEQRFIRAAPPGAPKPAEPPKKAPPKSRTKAKRRELRTEEKGIEREGFEDELP